MADFALPATGTGKSGGKASTVTTAAGADVQNVQLATATEGGSVTPVSSSNPLGVAIVGTVPISGAPTTVTANLGTIGGAATQTTLAAVLSALGTPLQAGGSVAVTSSALPTGAATQTTLASILTNLGTPLQAGGNVAVTSSTLPTGAATETTLAAVNTKLGSALPLPTGAATQTTLASLLAKTPALGTAGSGSTDVITVQGNASGTPIPVSGSFAGTTDVTASGSITASAQSVTASSLNGLATATLQVTGTFVGQINLQGTVDGSTWFFMTAGLDLTTGVPFTGSTFSAPVKYAIPVAGLSGFRVLSAGGWTSGTAVVNIRVSAASEYVALIQSLPFGTSQIGGVTLLDGNSSGRQAFVDTSNRLTVSSTLPTTTTGGYTISRTLAAASTNATSVKASAGQVFGWYLANAAAYAVFLKLYNKASSPTVGTDTPIVTIPVPAGAGANVEYVRGLPFGTGIAFAITKLVADSDTTVVAANDLVVNLFYA